MAKYIPLRKEGEDGAPASVDLIRAALDAAAPNSQGINYAIATARIRVYDALKDATDGMTLEDADVGTLDSALKSFAFTRAPESWQRRLVDVVSDVTNAKKPE